MRRPRRLSAFDVVVLLAAVLFVLVALHELRSGLALN